MIGPENLSPLSRFVDGRSVLGQLAILEGLLTVDQLQSCLDEERRSGRKLEDILLERRLLTPDQLDELLRHHTQAKAMEVLAEAPAESIRTVGKYALVKEIGRGGAGVVWKAWDTVLNRWAAIKEPAAKGASLDRFIREAKAAARVRHPNLVSVFEVIQERDALYIVMDYVEGRTLDEAKLELAAACEAMAQICDAVHAMHTHGVLHRDIKPQNIFVDASNRAVLGDFGLAKILGDQPLTLEGTVMGTPEYMAPEQINGRISALGPESDVYALGATLYHVATGDTPFHGEGDVQSLFLKVTSIDPPSPRKANRNVSSDLESIILRAMAKDPRDRYATAADLGDDLRRYLTGRPLLPQRGNSASRIFRWLQRRSRGLIMALGVVIMATSLIAYQLHLRSLRFDYEEAADRGNELYRHALSLGNAPAPDREAWSKMSSRALDAFESACRFGPDRPGAWLMRGRCLLLLDREAEAQECWAKALSLDPDYGPALFERAKHSFQSYLARRLPPFLPVDLSKAPMDPGTQSLRESGLADLARARQARDLDPSEVRFLEGLLAIGEGKFSDAVASLKAYAEDKPSSHAYMMLATAALLGGDIKPAETAVGRALDLQPRAHRFKLRGDIRFALGNLDGALVDYDRSIELDSKNPLTFFQRGLIHQQRGDRARAIEDYNEALRLRPTFARALNNRGMLRADADPAGAIEDFQRAADADPLLVEPYANLGTALIKKGEYEAAVLEFDTALGFEPENFGYLRIRAFAKSLAGDRDGAIADYQAALRVSPGNPEVLFDLAKATVLKGEKKEAEELLQKAIEKAPADSPIRHKARTLLEELRKP